jgi:outer membrane protein assembly factor BamA
VLSDIQFRGNNLISNRNLLQNLKSKTGERMEEHKVFNDLRQIQSMYKQAGYPPPSVQYAKSINEKTGHGSITFQITEVAPAKAEPQQDSSQEKTRKTKPVG